MIDTDDGAPPPKAGRREWIGLAVLALPCLVYAMDMTVLNLAIPAIDRALAPSASELLWIIDIYGFGVAGFLITMGTLGDRFGRRRLLLIGAAAFGAASVAAAFSTSAGMLIAMRALLGVAGATLAPSTLSLIRNMFHHPPQRQFAIGIWIAAYSVGGAVGPLVGGLLLEFFWWGSVFLVAVPVMALLLLVGPALLPEYRDPDAGRVDVASVVLSLGAVLATIWGLKRMAEHGFGWLPLATLFAGAAGGAIFIRRQRRLAYPLLDLALFRSRTFSAAIAAYGLSCLAMLGVYILLAQLLQRVLGLSPLAAGLVTVPWSLAFALGSLAAPRLARRVAPVTVLVGGLAVSAAGFGLLTMVDGSGRLLLIIAGTVLMSLGMAPAFTIANEMIITSAPPERAGAASALSETAAEFSGALGIAVFGSLAALLYRLTLADSMPASASPAAARAALATLGGAVAAAQSIGGADGEALLAASRAAFIDAFRIAAGAGAAIMAGASLLAARILLSADAPPAAVPVRRNEADDV